MSVENQIAELTKQGATLTESVASIKKSLEQPVLPQRIHAGEGTLGYWGEGETVAVYVPSDGPKPMPKSLTRLPKGYKNTHWKSAGDFYREGYLAHRGMNTAEFKGKHESCFKAVQGMSAQEGASAGFMIMPEFNQQILEKLYDNDIWTRTDGYTVNNNMVFLANAETSRATGSRHGGQRGYWVDEGATITKSKPTMRRIEMSLKKCAIVVYLTDELLADTAGSLEQYIARKAAEEFKFMLGDVVFNGSGVQQPLGFLNSPALLSITKETNQAATTIVAGNIDKMFSRRYVGGNYAWYHNQDCGPQLDNLTMDVGTAGVALYRPQDGIAGTAPMTLKGLPRVETEFSASVGTVGDLALADLKQYISISKGGITQAVSTEIEFLTDQTAIRFTMRVNGRPWETTPVTPYKGSNTQSSFLVTETR